MKQSKTDKRELIFDALEELMNKMPFKDISVESIARAAGVAKGSVYYYFDSKEEILNSLIERGYRRTIAEYLSTLSSEKTALGRIKKLFHCATANGFGSKQNLIMTLHLNDDDVLHIKLKSIAVQELSPILTVLLEQGVEEGSIRAEYPKESAEIIVTTLTVFLDEAKRDDPSVGRKLKIFANVLETCLETPKGSFDFLFTGG